MKQVVGNWEKGKDPAKYPDEATTTGNKKVCTLFVSSRCDYKHLLNLMYVGVVVGITSPSKYFRKAHIHCT